MGTHESKESSILEGVDGVHCDKHAAIINALQQFETRQEMINQQLEVQALENQIAVDNRKQEIGKQCIKEDQEITHAEENCVWDIKDQVREEQHKVEERNANSKTRRARKNTGGHMKSVNQTTNMW